MNKTKLVSAKLQASQAMVEAVGHRFKHLSIALRGTQEIATVLAQPDAWTDVQADRVRCLNKGDRVSLISPDGLVLADQAMVTKAEAGHLWFSKPLRLVSLEDVALFSDAKHRVVSVGTGYSIQTLRDGRTDDKIFGTVEAAKSEILRREPVKAA